MVQESAARSGPGRRRAMEWILLFDLAVAAAPPLHWAMGQGSRGWSIGYFLVSSVLITLSLFVLAALDSTWKRR